MQTYLFLIAAVFGVRAVTWVDCTAQAQEELNTVRKKSSTSPYSIPFVGFASAFTTHSMQASIVGEGKFECANFSVPLDWDTDTPTTCATGSGCINYFVKRIVPTEESRKAAIQARPALWFLNGGPGGDGSSMIPLIASVVNQSVLLDKFDLYFPDHRGTGNSNPLSCKITEIPVTFDAKCVDQLTLKYGNSLHFYTVTNAAKDTAFAMAEVGTNNLIYGVSYGTYLANRILLVADKSKPFYPKAVVLDGVCPGGGCRSAASYDTSFSRAELKLLPYCSEDKFCSSKFAANGGVEDVLVKLFEDVNQGYDECAKQLNITSDYVLSAILGQLVASWKTRPMALAVVHRMQRCDSDDLTVLRRLFGFLTHSIFFLPGDWNPPKTPLPEAVDAPVLGPNILLSEMWDADEPHKDQPCEVIFQNSRVSLFSKGAPLALCEVGKIWNKYRPDSLAGEFATPPNTTTSLLLLNGELDPKTPLHWAEHAENEYTKRNVNAKLVVVPMADHGTILEAPVAGLDGLPTQKNTCGIQMMLSFLMSPGNGPDTSCLSKLATIDWAGKSSATQEMSSLLMGTTDIWGGGELGAV